eukprot:TRINITY_DN15192_c0_g1_i3.p1 TRINITY_DN15192_c0_g1~~TRINITY_DN15192_c0_g1_i3.p1  ORF type:complete len:184 (-),score=40.04 TRINITY_DN15192_c0_g1_i3:163-648(-)
MTTVLQASVDHLEDLIPLFELYLEFYKQEPKPLETRQFLKDRLEKNEATVFLAYVDGKAVGFTLLYPTFSSLYLARAWILYDLFVLPSVRRQGIAKILIERAHQLGADTKAGEMQLETAFDNLPAQALYEKLGWRVSEYTVLTFILTFILIQNTKWIYIFF